MTKHQLTISPDYVPSWGYVEGVRELFQNALDNEITNPANKMYFSYDADTELLIIGNKLSHLEPETLLMGYSSKRDDDKTVGQHGEGYKVAIMVLLRSGFNITFFNYGAKETWSTRLVRSRKYNGASIVEIDIQKHIFKSVPANHLEIHITGITEDMYNELVKANINLKNYGDSEFLESARGKILLNPKERGRIYVNGLFVTEEPNYHYGYSIKPNVIKLDRDRSLIRSFDLQWVTSAMWGDNGDSELLAPLLLTSSSEIKYISSVSTSTKVEVSAQKVYESLITEELESNSDLDEDDIVIVSTQSEMSDALKIGKHPKLVDSNTKDLLVKLVPKVVESVNKVKDSLDIHPKDELEAWYNSIAYRLGSTERVEFARIFKKL